MDWNFLSLISACLVMLGGIFISLEKTSKTWQRYLVVIMCFLVLIASIAQRIEMTESKRSENDMKTLMEFVRYSVGNLGALDNIGGDGEYNVRIAYAENKENLEKSYLDTCAQFKGAKESKMVDILPYQGGYALVFGKNLNLVAAEAFQRLAIGHRLTPYDEKLKRNQHPEIELTSKYK